MNDKELLKRLISTADALETEASNARCAVAVHIRSQDRELAAILDDLLPALTDQANWLFQNIFRRNERPVDICFSGREAELREIVGRILHGSHL